MGNLIQSSGRGGVEHVLTHASKVHPQMRAPVRSAYAVWWRKVKYRKAATPAGRNAERRAKLKVDNRIVVGSAAVTPHLSRTGRKAQSQPDGKRYGHSRKGR